MTDKILKRKVYMHESMVRRIRNAAQRRGLTEHEVLAEALIYGMRYVEKKSKVSVEAS